jgi:sugar-specific transcriptional regulator TrmB
MDTKALEDIGLTQGEIKVYMALLEIGASTAGPVLEKAGVQNSVFHFCVNRLIEKGLVSYVKKGKVRIYQPADPDNFMVYLKGKEKEIEKILPELKAKQSLAKEKEEVELFEGKKGIMTMLNMMIEDGKKGDEFLFFTADVEERNEEIQKFYRKYDLRRKEKGLVRKGIVPAKMKSLVKKLHQKDMQLKFTDQPIPANTGIFRDKMALVSWGEKPKGVLIKSRQIVEKERNFFSWMWNSI